MDKKRLVVIGGVAAGTKAASKARRENPDWEVIVITRDNHISYAGCGLPYYLGGVIKERSELVVRGPQEFKEEQDILVLTRREASSIDPMNKTVIFTEVDTGKVHTIQYDYLILATGASPVFPPLQGINHQNIYPLRTVMDADSIKDILAKEEVKDVVVVGAGFVGLEAAENLILRGYKVTVVEMTPLVLPGYDEEIALYIQNYLTGQGLDIRTGACVSEFTGDSDGNVTGAKLWDGTVIPAQLVIWAGGVRPNVDLAVKAGIVLGQTKAIAVDAYQETNIKDIFAVGDCSENVNLLTREAAWCPMGSTANKTGRVVGLNLDREDKEGYFPGVLGTSVIKLFELNAARTGLTEKQAREKGFNPVSVVVPANDRAHYYPGYRQIITKLIADRNTQRILGVQIVGEGVVDKPVDIIVTLISCQAVLEQAARLDLAYAPPFSMALSSTILAAQVLINKIQGKFPGINPSELATCINDGAVVLDVRTEAEYFIRAIPGSLNIPFNELSTRYGEIPRDRKLILVCKVGKRAYLNLQKLKSLGFTDLAVLEGGTEAYPYTLE